MVATVGVARTSGKSPEEIRKVVYSAIERSGFKPPPKVDPAALKVNLRYYWDYSTGETTDPRVVSALIDYLRDCCGVEEIIVAEADASAMRTRYSFKMLGYEKLSESKKVKLVNLSKAERVEIEVEVDGEEFRLPVPKLALEAGLFINVPKLRTHRLTTISVGLKNLFGAIAKPRKIVYHPRLNEVIVAANKILKTNLVLVDGIIVLGKYPVNFGIAMASEDQLACDVVSTKLMGYNPNKIKHIQLAYREGVGEAKSIETRDISEAEIRELSKKFLKENYFVYNLMWDIKLLLLKTYLKTTGDTRPPVLDR